MEMSARKRTAMSEIINDATKLNIGTPSCNSEPKPSK